MVLVGVAEGRHTGVERGVGLLNWHNDRLVSEHVGTLLQGFNPLQVKVLGVLQLPLEHIYSAFPLFVLLLHVLLTHEYR